MLVLFEFLQLFFISFSYHVIYYIFPAVYVPLPIEYPIIAPFIPPAPAPIAVNASFGANLARLNAVPVAPLIGNPAILPICAVPSSFPAFVFANFGHLA